MNNKNKLFMREAIKLSLDNVKSGGGPFGAVVVKNMKIIARGCNEVVASKDPTGHAEIVAIRNAAAFLDNFDLSDCEIYTSCEPCPMCLGAIYWSRIARIYYGNTKQDAAEIDFDDDFIYQELELAKHKRKIPAIQLLSHEAKLAFAVWETSELKNRY